MSARLRRVLRGRLARAFQRRAGFSGSRFRWATAGWSRKRDPGPGEWPPSLLSRSAKPRTRTWTVRALGCSKPRRRSVRSAASSRSRRRACISGRPCSRP